MATQDKRPGVSGQKLLLILGKSGADLVKAQEEIIKALQALKVDTNNVITEMEQCNANDEERITRLIALARSHGLVVEIQGDGGLKITRPTNVSLLQHSHDHDQIGN